MKKWIFIWVLCTFFTPVFSQSQEAEQLLLNLEKLTQLKSILADMKKGYTILSQGYGSIKQISQGNFSLHQSFLKGMMLVNPEIKKYRRLADIIAFQQQLVKTYKFGFEYFKTGGSFSTAELAYLGNVYGQLFTQSRANLDELAMVLTDSRLGMSDQERLKAIDRIFEDSSTGLEFLQHFNLQLSILEGQRRKEMRDAQKTWQYFKPVP